MLMVIVLVVLGIAFFVGGVIFIIKGVRNEENDEVSAVVPISDMKEIHNIKNDEMWEATAKLEKEPEIQRIIEPDSSPAEPAAPVEAKGESAMVSLEEFEQLKLELEEFKVSAEKEKGIMKDENQRLNEALNRELSSRDEKTLSQDEREQLVWKENKLKESQEARERLTKENHVLSGQLDEIKVKNDQLLQEMSTVRDAMEQEKQSLIEKVDLHNKEKEELEEVIKRLQQQINEISDQNTKHISDSIEKLQIENQDLKTENVKYTDMIKGLQEDLELIKIKNEQKLRDSEKTIADLKIKVSEIGNQLQTKTSDELEYLRKEVVKVQYENQQLAKNNSQIQADFQQAKEYNERLLEKEGLLHYELTKSRAQVLGLEKICMDFKIQLEEMDSVQV